MGTVRTFGTVDERSLKQLERCMEAGDAEFGVLCADHHPGYSQPIGGGIAYEGHVSPSGVGYDIGCGNKAVRTDLVRADREPSVVVRDVADAPLSRTVFGAIRHGSARRPALNALRAALRDTAADLRSAATPARGSLPVPGRP